MPDQKNKKENNKTTAIQKSIDSVVVGAPRAIITFGAGHPFDLVKTRMQANPQIESAALLSKEIFLKTGIKGFYVGGLANSTRHMIKNAYRDPVRGYSKVFYKAKFPDASEASIGAAVSLTMSSTDTYCSTRKNKSMVDD